MRPPSVTYLKQAYQEYLDDCEASGIEPMEFIGWKEIELDKWVNEEYKFAKENEWF
jgi:hypothetical protein